NRVASTHGGEPGRHTERGGAARGRSALRCALGCVRRRSRPDWRYSAGRARARPPNPDANAPPWCWCSAVEARADGGGRPMSARLFVMARGHVWLIAMAVIVVAMAVARGLDAPAWVLGWMMVALACSAAK